MRSSSFNAYSMCPMRYFIDFNLLRPGVSGFSADKGTAYHKIMEIIAICKKNHTAGKKTYVDEICGKLKTIDYDLNEIINKVFEYYSKLMPHHNWTNKELKEITGWIKKAQEYDNGKWYPANLDIVDTEVKFDFEIFKEWALANFNVCGNDYNGFLRLKGSIDLVIKIDEQTYMGLDHKTGRGQWDWAKNKEKTIEDFYNDPQLRIYHYALSNLYPHINNIWMSIWYINGGGVFSICFDKNDLNKTEEMIKRRFEEIKNCNSPSQYKSFKCKSFCWHGKNTFENTEIKPIIEFREGQVCKRGEKMTVCEQIKYEIDKKGLKRTVEEYKNKDKDFDFYQEPGGAK
jgi:hypothetical protein